MKNMQGMSGVIKKLANNSWLSRAEIDPLCSGRADFLSRFRDFGFISRFSIFHFPFFYSTSTHPTFFFCIQTMPSQTILAPQAILPGDLRPQPATIIFDTDSGMITSVTPGIHKLDENANVWEIEQGKILLPGLIEYVPFLSPTHRPSAHT